MTRRVSGKNIFVVEDNPLIAFDLLDTLEDIGAHAIGPAASVSAGLAIVDDPAIDAALMDIELGEELVWPIAHALLARGIPFAFVSGRCPDEFMPPEFTDHICLTKPADAEEILTTLDSLVDRPG